MIETNKRLQVREELCSGCRACEVACVAHHENRFGIASARLHVRKVEQQGLDRPRVCQVCEIPFCVDACPDQALRQDDVTRAILLNPDDCTGCASCVDACPFEAARLHPQTSLALICDLCAGDPACVKRCATGAIAYAALPGAS